MRGPEQGVCDMIGTECCTIIPLHTGPMGPLSVLLTRMKAARDQMVRNSGAPDPAWYKWLLSGDWMAGLMRIGMTILVVLLVVAFIACCGIPLLRALIDKTVHSLFGQYMQMQMLDADTEPDLFPLLDENNNNPIMDCLPFRRPPRQPARRHYSCAYLDSDSNGQAYRFYNASNAPHLFCCFSCRKLAMEIDLSAYRWWLYLKLDREPQRTWRSYPPRSSQDQWVPLQEDAHIMIEEGSWIAWHRPGEDYCLADRLVMRVHAYELRRCIAVASLYGPKTRHAYLLSRNIQQSTVRQYYTLFFCGYPIWTTHTREALENLARLPPQPAWLHPILRKNSDSEAVVILPKTYSDFLGHLKGITGTPSPVVFVSVCVCVCVSVIVVCRAMLRLPPRQTPDQYPRACGHLEVTPRGFACRVDDVLPPNRCHTCNQLSSEIAVSDYVWRDFDLGVAPYRTWLTYPPPPTADTWYTLLEDSRPVTLILDHADLFLPEGLWVHVYHMNEYALETGFRLEVHSYEIRRSFCVASTYGRGSRHAYIFSRHIVQTTTRQYCTLFFCGYKLWTSHTNYVRRGLQATVGPPTFMYSWKGGSSDAVANSDSDYACGRFRDIWGALRVGRRVRAPLPLWIRSMHRNHHWWWK
ncbi:hypothetical protein Q7C36_017204 [Tachysurus vachellii]|uniref:Uncharacterized protein n=1 Tax=Tachysurus vachellii TaxID=175792 RepID=A0AA88M4R5_TACVA|nr:hypothetical protein Q7C36_017204 [Tachysurus vachellii]